MQYTYNSKGELISGGSSNKTSSVSQNTKDNNTIKNDNNTATGYGKGMGYSNRETAFVWSDGTVTYSNATDYRDAAAAAGKDLNKVSLKNATTYGTGSLTGNGFNYGVTAVGDGSGKSGFTNKLYSNKEGYGNGYDMAKMQMEYLSGLYDYDYTGGLSTGSGAYGKGLENSMMANLGINGLSGGVDWMSAYDKAAKKQASAIQSRADALINSLNNNREDYERQFDEIARQAYVSSKQSQLVLPQQLAASGLTGGASETSMLKLALNYENAINENETNRLYMNKDIDTQIYNTQLTADSDIASMESEYYLSALSAYENQMNQQNDLYMNLLNYQLSKDKLSQQAYYDNLDYELAMKKLEASASADEYDRLTDRANTLGKYGIFSGYTELGYSADEISAMQAAYIARNTKAAKKKKDDGDKDDEIPHGSDENNILTSMGTGQIRDMLEASMGLKF